MYKQASKLKLRWQTTKGSLSVEQLWELSQTDLANAIKAVKKILKKTDDDDLLFLDGDKTVDVENQLRFDILKDVYLTKKQENEAIRNAAETKAYNQKILQLIEDKKAAKLGEMTIEQLEAMLK